MGIISRFFWKLNCKGAFANAANKVKARFPSEYDLMLPLYMGISLEQVKTELFNTAIRYHATDLMEYLNILNEEYAIALRKFYHPPHCH